MIVLDRSNEKILEDLASENEKLRLKLKKNLEEIYKRKELVKLEKEHSELVNILPKHRKTFAFMLEYEIDNYTFESDIDIRKFLIDIVSRTIHGNEIRIYYQLNKFIYFKTKYNCIISSPCFIYEKIKLVQISPKNILKKQDNCI